MTSMMKRMVGVWSLLLAVAACSAGSGPADGFDGDGGLDAGRDGGDGDSRLDADDGAGDDGPLDGGDRRSDGGGDSDGGGECPAEPPADPQPSVCHEWSCSLEPAPACWRCQAIPAAEGRACQPAGPAEWGLCRQGDCAALPEDPAAAGPEPVVEAEAVFPIPDDPGAELALTVRLPASGQDLPLVVLNQGFQLDPSQYLSYAEHLASWGYAVVLPGYPGSMLAPRNHRRLADDLLALLDWLDGEGPDPAGLFEGRVDPGRLVLAGHSMGGKIALLVASEDDRPLTVFGIDPVDAAGGPFGGDPENYPSVTPERMDAIGVPLVLLGETVNATCTGFACQACAPEEDNFHQYFIHATAPALEIELVGADHMAFLDNPDCGLVCSACPDGPTAPEQVRRLTRRALLAHLQSRVRGLEAWRVFLDGAAAARDEADGLLLLDAANGF